MSIKSAKIALVFDWMTTAGGAEKVNLKLHQMFPQADIFTSVYNPNKVKGFENANIKTSFIQNMPFAKKYHQLYLGMMPYAYESFDLSEYDIVISSSHSCAKGVITKPETMHVCYCHTPMRYAWDNWHKYINEYKINPLLKWIGKRRIHSLRMWDRLSAERVDYFIANSSTTKKRIAKYYKKASTTIFPMIDTSKFKASENTKGYFLAVGRLIPYKRFDLIIDTFNKIGLPLKIVGRGIMESELKKQANSNIEFIGYADDLMLQNIYAQAEALIFPQVEDFGITALESQASGRPVIAYKKGGALDTIVENETGIFFDNQTVESLKNAIEKFQKTKDKFSPQLIREKSLEFDEKQFEKKLFKYISDKWEGWNN